MTSCKANFTTLGEAVRVASSRLAEAGVESNRLDARLLIAHATGITPETILTYPERDLTDADAERVQELLARRMAREPMSHILGEREFWSMSFEVTADTLTPRPDTETLIETVLEHHHANGEDGSVRILDLGTGTGCILLALLKEFPKATGVGVDLSADALVVAKRNAVRHCLESRAEFVGGTWFVPVNGRFDIIVSNPPYIETAEIPALEREVSEHEPGLALDGGQDGLVAYREICAGVSEHLNPGGLLAFEIGSRQANAVDNLMTNAGLSDVSVAQDLAGRDRVVSGWCRN